LDNLTNTGLRNTGLRDSGLRIGVIGLPGKWSTEKLADAVEEKTGFRLVIDMQHVSLDLSTQTLIYQGYDLCQFDALILKKISKTYSPDSLNRLELLRIAERAGVRVFSNIEKTVSLINRMSCTISLKNAGVPMPKTCITEDVDAALDAVKDYGSAVLKPLFSTKARGMCIIDEIKDTDNLKKQISAFNKDNPMMYVQKKMNLPGQDLGMIFLGGTYLGSYARVAKDDAWNTTIHSGGHYVGYEPDAAVIDIAQKAQAVFNMDFTTVDVAETDQGPVVFEVSAFGGFRGALEGCGINAADLYVDYILKNLGT
jgi:ribosomal protein S6--L-glutamate ligase